MKIKSRIYLGLCLIFVVVIPTAANSIERFDESVNHAPPFQIYQNDTQLRELLPAKGGSSLCWPSSVAHRMYYFQKYRHPALSNFSLPTTSGRLDLAEAVKIFVRLCHTSTSGGTPQSAKIPCIIRYFQENGYHPIAFAVGKSATGVAASTGAHNELRPVQISDLRKYIALDYGVILHVGWLKFDPRRKSWVESGSHSLNAYGYDYDKKWGDERIILKVSNPAINYSARAESVFFDAITVSALNREPGIAYPPMVSLSISGPGFDKPGRLAVINDLFVFSPDHAF